MLSFVALLGKAARNAAPEDDPRPWRELAARYRPHLPDVTLAKGDVVADDHEVLDVLSRDALAVTYLVYSHRRQAPFALKTPRNQFLRDRAANEGFRRAARAW
ncbi:MAG TPA: hypothetical protein VG370_22510, partial [Chloroflexota bacterium]|nr:hypothetical protein [Chloroflexota bacterium]